MKLIAEILGVDEEDVPYINSEDVEIVWIDEGTVFRIDEYDGAEDIVLQKDEDLLTA